AFQSVCTRFLDIAQLIRTNETEDAVPGSAETVAADSELQELIGAAYREAKRDDAGFARLQQVGQIAGNRSSFDVRNYGFKSLSEMFRSLPNFKIEQREGGQLWVKRLR
ncbi:MAG: OST-HTH/LOTUS domain-containing protein, partial [Tsuneonella sp.]